MRFLADLHIHSRFSRATSRQLTPRTLAAWGMVKGLHVLGTGDFTHPGWRAELRDMLERDGQSGLYRLKEAAAPALALPGVGRVDSPPPLFLLQGEISSIYKRHGKVRRVHNLVYMPDLDSAERLSHRLEGIGNLASDGRPILGLDSRNLLEMVLEADSRGVVIPAHIWTPWFAIFGSKSGFDSMEECFDDLTPHIFALETGLSSDPDMNRLWSHLDRYTLISNSDAHSGANLGREANAFTGNPSYDGIFDALRRKANAACTYAGTVEFFPEEGKYHLDGHRACDVVLTPQESRQLHNICPVCGKPLTIGVLHRVTELADRSTPAALAEDAGGFVSLIPLPEVLGELLGAGTQSRRVVERYTRLVETLGPEMHILHTLPEAELRQHWEGLGEAIARMRRGEVIRQGGYDGEYGTVRVFTPQEAASLRAGRSRASLPGMQALPAAGAQAAKTAAPPPPAPALPLRRMPSPAAAQPTPAAQPRYTPEQQAALEAGPQPVLVMAGPGAGKTHTLLGRVCRLLEHGAPPHTILVVTFTRRAAEELRQRLSALGCGGALPRCDTLHALAWARLQGEAASAEHGPQPPLLLGEDAARALFAQANAHLSAAALRHAWEHLQAARERGDIPPALAPALALYQQHKSARHFVDYTDLLEGWCALLEGGTETVPAEQGLLQHLLVDEVQDLSPLQWRILARLLPSDGNGFFGIGDPDQAIYGFRGAQENTPHFVRHVWPHCLFHSLSLSHRSAPGIVRCANALMQGHSHCGELRAQRQEQARVQIFHAPNAGAEARWVAEQIGALLGGTSHTLQDRAAVSPAPAVLRGAQAAHSSPLAPADVAVLVRLKAQIPALHKALEQAGLPCAVPEQEGCWHDARVALLLQKALEQAGPAPAPSTTPPPQGLIWPRTEPHIWQGGLAQLRRHLEAQHFADSLFWEGAAWKALRKLWEAEPGWPALLARVALLRDVEMARHKAERVQIMTLHAAKGLEFEAVFLPGLEQGLLPLDRAALWGAESADRNGGHDDEERRLFYVGITRAARMLYLSHAAQRTLAGRSLHLPPSPLLEPVRAHAVCTALKARAHRSKEQLSLL